MTPLPVIRGASSALYPFTQTYICQTGVSDAQNGSATRWVKGPPLLRFELPYQPLTRTEKNSLVTAFSSAAGEFTTTLSLTTDITYNNLSLDSDEVAAVEEISTRYGVKWSVTQTLSQSLSPGTSGTAFPTLSNGAIGQLPYRQRKRYQTIAGAMRSGPKYTYAEFAGGLANFPTGGLMAWEFDYNCLSDTEVSSLVAHFLANWGNCFHFSFTDEDGTTYPKVYYGSPELSIVRRQFGQSALKITLIQTF